MNGEMKYTPENTKVTLRKESGRTREKNSKMEKSYSIPSLCLLQLNYGRLALKTFTEKSEKWKLWALNYAFSIPLSFLPSANREML